MSFADEVREELCALPVKKPCCRRALAAGLLLFAERQSADRVCLLLRYESVARVAREVLGSVYSNPPLLSVSGSHGHHYWSLALSSPAAARLVTHLADENADLEGMLRLDACEGCRSAFLRGIFLAVGSVSDPNKLSHLELLIPRVHTADAVSGLLERLGYPPKRVARKNGTGLYYKDGGAVGDLITLMGSHSIIFEFYNARIAGDIRNNENRATNCVAKNIEKSVLAAARQMEAIGQLMEHGRLESLPEPLRVTAMLRYRNPDATLDELRMLHTPPISKSGLSHRLQRLMDAADESRK